MVSIHTRLEGAFVGHAIACQFDPSNQMALQLSESILSLKCYDGPDILSRYLHLYHTTRCNIGETTKFVYQNLKSKIRNNDQSPLARHHFLFTQSSIDETVKMANTNFNGCTAGCNPAHRSFPLALCSSINDDDVFQFSIEEAALTHHNPIAGQVAGIINVICRSLLRNQVWHDAVNTAFTSPRLHQDVLVISVRHCRSPNPTKETHAAYAPTMLHSALHCIANATNAKEAIERAREKDKYYCPPIVGLLAGARWGIPPEMCENHGIHNSQLLRGIRETTNKLSSLWDPLPDPISA